MSFIHRILGVPADGIALNRRREKNARYGVRTVNGTE
jgi:hypothetical protein